MSAFTAVPDTTGCIIRHWKMNAFIKCLASAKRRRILSGMRNVCNAQIHTKNLQLEYIITGFENKLIELHLHYALFRELNYKMYVTLSIKTALFFG